MRACPYCDALDAGRLGERLGATFLRCRRCRSIYMDLTPAQYERLHDHAFSDQAYIDEIVSEKHETPDRTTWAEFRDLLPHGPLLEIGPGTGHLLAAAREANRPVYALESSRSHREFIRRAWGIETVFGSFSELPASAPKFAAVLAFNTIEHVFDVGALFAATRPHLAPGGVILISTCNAECIIVPVVGVYWSMFKQPDHVSIPSAEGLRRLGARAGFSTERVWTGELPLETPIGLATAARDFVRERWMGREPARGGDGPAASTAAPGTVPLGRRFARFAVRTFASTDPTRYLTARVGRSAAIRGLFRVS
jgi:SAM-dependent methyltransferase